MDSHNRRRALQSAAAVGIGLVAGSPAQAHQNQNTDQPRSDVDELRKRVEQLELRIEGNIAAGRNRVFNVRDYGTDQAAVDKAVGELTQAGGGTLYFPLDDYHLDKKLSFGAIPIWIQGGHPNTRLIWANDDGGIQFQGAVNRPMLKISDIQICTAKTDGGTGIRADWGLSTKGKEPACIIENVQVRSIDAPETPNGEHRYNYSWTKGIHLSNVCNVTMNNVTLKGGHPANKPPYKGTIGILIDGERPGTNGFFMSNLFVSDWYDGVVLRSHAEGPYLSNFEITAVVKGLTLDNVSTAKITNGHVDFWRRAVLIQGSHGVHWSNTYLLKGMPEPFPLDPTDPPTHNVRFAQIENSDTVTFIGNEFQMIGEGGVDTPIAVEVWEKPGPSLEKVIIMGNTCWGFTKKAFRLNGGVRGCKIVGNTCEDSENPPWTIAEPNKNEQGFNAKQ